MNNMNLITQKKSELFTLLCSVPESELTNADVRLKRTLANDEHVQYVISLSERIRSGRKG